MTKYHFYKIKFILKVIPNVLVKYMEITDNKILLGILKKNIHTQTIRQFLSRKCKLRSQYQNYCDYI